MLERLRTFGIILQEGSLNRAARRLHVSQPSLTRQMQGLEAEIGAPLLERQTSGVKPTALGQKLLEATHPLIEQFDAVIADIRRGARGQQTELRVGYLGSAAERYLSPALSDMRQDFPEMKVHLLDLSPGEQITALKAGKLDLALIGQEGAALSGDFYTRKLAVLGVRAHPRVQRTVYWVSASQWKTKCLSPD
jgi:DNA-binding transcriptional LysR family regulator